MFIAEDPTPHVLRSEERQPHRISDRTDTALPNGARVFGEFVAINIPLPRSEGEAKLTLPDEARVGSVLLFGALQ